MITINLTLDTRRAKKDNSFPIVFRIVSKGVVRDISTEFSALETQWNSKTNTIRENHPLFPTIEPELKEKKIFYLSRILEYEKAYPMDMDTQKIKEYLLSKPRAAITVY